MKLKCPICLLAAACLLCGSARAQESIPDEVLAAIRDDYRPMAELLAVKPGQVPTIGNRVRVIIDGEEKLGLLIADILSARSSVNMEYFIFVNDEGSRLVRTALKLKALDSLDVRFILEDMRQAFTPSAYYDSMAEAGVQLCHYPFFPINTRNHQKVVTIDGAVGYTGGMNIAGKYFYEWHDTDVRIEGPAVASLDAVFAEMWKHVHGRDYAPPTPAAPFPDGIPVQIVADGPSGNHYNLQAYIWALNHAQSYFYAKTPYFAPPKELLDVLKNAAARGVDVRLVLPAPELMDEPVMVPVNASCYRELLEAGIRLSFSEGRFDHSKIFACDDYLSAIGSVNMDGRSLLINHEDNAYFYDEGMALQVKELILRSEREGEPITLDYVNSFTPGFRFLCALLRPFRLQF